VLSAASVNQGDYFTNNFGRSSLAACSSNAQTMYAIAADTSGDSLAAVWKSSDGGQNWGMVNLPPSQGPPPNETGHQGWYNQAVAVSPANCNTVAIGWEYATFVSFDVGATYPMTLYNGGSGCQQGVCNLHDDYHALLFDPSNPQLLWLGTDGGLSSANGVFQNGTPRYTSYYNEHLADLQMYHASASFHTNLIAAPLQDNAVVWSAPSSWWTRVPGASGDGAYTEFTGASQGGSDVLDWNSPGYLVLFRITRPRFRSQTT
jgi:hypothetical protein